MAADVEVSDEILEKLRGVTAATVTMQLIKRGIRRCALVGPRPFLGWSGEPVVGPAFTMRFLPMREDLSTLEGYAKPGSIRDAIEAMPAGQVVVMATRGEQGCGTLGDILAARLQKCGARAVVSDGPMRDVAGIDPLGLPIFCTGAAALPSIAGHWFADWQRPVACGGVTVVPGDIIVADRDGAVVLPRALAAEVADAAPAQEHFEAFAQAKVTAGAPVTGLYPPNEATQREYERWCEAGEPPIEITE